MYWYGEGMGAGWYWLMAISWIGFLALLVVGVVLLLRYLGRGGRAPGAPPGPYQPGPGYSGGQPTATGHPGAQHPGAGPAPGASPVPPPYVTPPPHLTPEQVLADRYARGEIDDEEFQRRLSTLRAEAGPPDGPRP